MAAQIITIAIEKGGAGKTVTASNLAYLMGDEGKKVLCIDTDPQGNLTSAHYTESYQRFHIRFQQYSLLS